MASASLPPRSRLWLVPAGLLTAALVMAVGPYQELMELSEATGGPLDESPRGTPAEVTEHFTSIGARGLDLYRAHFWWDLPFGLTNALALWAMVTVGLGRTRLAIPRAVRAVAAGLPVLAAVLDVAENVAVSVLVRQADAPGETITLATHVVTSAKFLAFGAAGLAAIGSIALWLLFRRRPGQTGTSQTTSSASSTPRTTK
ncbi:MAG: hypothetical protein AAF957_24015 [Planctomycetota bacterium]